MKRAVFIPILVGVAMLGSVVAQVALRSSAFRDRVGVALGRGHLVALTRDCGIYEIDVQRRFSEEVDASGGSFTSSRQTLLEGLVAQTTVESLAKNEHVDPAEVDREVELLRAQFADEKRWRATLARSGLSTFRLRGNVRAQLRAARWLKRELESPEVTTAACAQVYESERRRFEQSERFRASHLFLAAPPETPPEVVDLKGKTIESLWQRLRRGEDFFELVAQASEDEATKTRGGDLDWFSDWRMPPDFMVAVRGLAVGAPSRPVRTRLGFHLIKLTDRKPPRVLTFAEAEPEIRLELADRQRENTVRGLAARHMAEASFVRRLGP